MVGLDPSMTLTYRSEYKALGADRVPKVQLVQEWLASQLDGLPELPGSAGGDSFFSSRTAPNGRTLSGRSLIGNASFAGSASILTVLPSGCCGMAGTYGHEARHRTVSERIYALSWKEKVGIHGHQGRLLATGYSCRSQVKIIDGVALRHPVQALRIALLGSPRLKAASGY